jgi:uncharacterized delta-60 repeat protein
MKSKSFIISLCLSILFSQFLPAQPGSLDDSFGNEGIVIAPLSSSDEFGYQVALQPDNKIVLAGYVETNNIRDFAVARYNPDGSMDNSFGNGGLVIFDGGTDADMAVSMILQDDGKILIGGSVYNQFTTVDDYAMVRFNADGTPDNTFGTGGLVTTDFGGNWDNAYAMAIQDDGKILLAGEAYTEGKRNVGIVRYNPDGSCDCSFASTGFAILSIGSVLDRTRAIALQTDGKILAAGWFNDGLDDQLFLTRFNTDGSSDNTFGNNGVATLDIGGKDDRCWDIKVLTDGKILVSGSNGTPGNNDYLLVKYLSDGTLDNNFGSNGIALNNFGINDLALEMLIQADGKILTAGSAFTFELIRFLETGYPDPDFGNNGIVNTNIGTNSSFSQTLTQQTDGKIIVAGFSSDGTNRDFSLARYHAEESGYIIDQDETFQSVSLYPNPVSDNHFTIEYLLSSGQDISIELLSADGKQVQVLQNKQHRKAGNNTEVLSLPGSISDGLYFIRLSSLEGSSILKLNVD